jgi:hypothetical protein
MAAYKKEMEEYTKAHSSSTWKDNRFLPVP